MAFTLVLLRPLTTEERRTLEGVLDEQWEASQSPDGEVGWDNVSEVGYVDDDPEGPTAEWVIDIGRTDWSTVERLIGELGRLRDQGLPVGRLILGWRTQE